MDNLINQIEQTGAIPKGQLQAIVKNAKGELLPQWRQKEIDLTGKDGKQKELIYAGMRYQDKSKEFNNNPILTTHAYKYGDKSTRQGLKNGFPDDEKAYVIDTMGKAAEINGTPLKEQDRQAINNALTSKTTSNNPASLQGLIFKGESNGNYNIVNGGVRHGYKASTKFNLNEKTINQILAEQQKGNYNAVGAYQIIPEVLQSAVKELGLTGNERFDKSTQDLIFSDYLTKKKRPQIYNFITGKSNDLKGANTALAREWASIEHKDGLSYYHKDGVNKAHVTAKESKKALEEMRIAYQMNLEKGMNEDEAYRTALTQGGNNLISSPIKDTDYELNKSIDIYSPVAHQKTQQQSNIDINAQLKKRVQQAFRTTRESAMPLTVKQAISGALKGV